MEIRLKIWIGTLVYFIFIHFKFFKNPCIHGTCWILISCATWLPSHSSTEVKFMNFAANEIGIVQPNTLSDILSQILALFLLQCTCILIALLVYAWTRWEHHLVYLNQTKLWHTTGTFFFSRNNQWLNVDLSEIWFKLVTWKFFKFLCKIILVIRFMADLLRKYRGSVVIMVGRGGAEPHYVHNWPPIFSW